MRFIFAVALHVAAALSAFAQDDQISSTTVRFCEGGWSTPAKKARVYATQFDRSKVRYIVAELSGDNGLYRKRDQKLAVAYKYFSPNGDVFATDRNTSSLPKEWPGFMFTGKVGWSRAGRWTGGTYRVEVLLNETKKLAEGTFTIVDDVANRPPFGPTPADNVRIARERFAIEDYDGALLFCQKALEQDPSFAEAHLARAGFRMDMWQFQLAVEDAARAVEFDPNRAEGYHLRARAHAALGSHELALPDYGRAIELDPRNSVYYRNRGLTKSRLKDYAGALSDVERCLVLNPSSADAFSDRGFLKQRVGDFTAALEDFGRAVKLNDKHASAHFNRGTVHLKLGARYQARLDFEVALRNGNETMRGNAAESLGDVGLTDSADALVGLLWDDDATVRRKAVYAMGRLKGKVYVSEVARLLRDEAVEVRRSAALALGEIGGSDRVEDLVALLSDADSVVKAHAVFSLAKLGVPRPDVAKSLIKDADSHVRGDAIEALGLMGDKKQAPDVLPFLKDEDPDLRLRALGALARMGDREHAAAISALLDDPELGRMYTEEKADWKDAIISDLAARTLRDWGMDPQVMRPKGPAAARREIAGSYDIREGTADGKIWGEMTLGTVSADGSFEVTGHEWKGRGLVTGDRGYYDWRRLDGTAGRTVFTVDAQGRLNGRSAGSGTELRFVALKK